MSTSSSEPMDTANDSDDKHNSNSNNDNGSDNVKSMADADADADASKPSAPCSASKKRKKPPSSSQSPKSKQKGATNGSSNSGSKPDSKASTDSDNGSDVNENDAHKEKGKDKVTANGNKKVDTKSPAKSTAKSTAKPKSTTKSSSSSSSSSSVSYIQMVENGIIAMKDRTGSSQPAILKWVMANHPGVDETKFKKHLPRTLKQGLQSERFARIKCSYKLHTKQIDKNRAKRKSAKAKLVSMQKAAAAKKAKAIADAAKKKKEAAAQKAAKAKAAKAKEAKAGKGKPAQSSKDGKPVKTNGKGKGKEKTASSSSSSLSSTAASGSASASTSTTSKATKPAEKTVKIPTPADRAEQKRLERIRKRKFPMEDDLLHKEDKELKVSPPDTVKPRQLLPMVIQTHPSSCRWEGPTAASSTGASAVTSAAPAASTPNSKTLPSTAASPPTPAATTTTTPEDDAPLISMGEYSPVESLWDNILYVYHFFRGDLGWGKLVEERRRTYASSLKSKDKMPPIPVVAPFTLHQLQHAVCQVLYGNAKRSKTLPPLLTHLFVVAMQYLVQDIPTLSIGLDCTSWSEICMYYIDAMGRYYSIPKARSGDQDSDDNDDAAGGGDDDNDADADADDGTDNIDNHTTLASSTLLVGITSSNNPASATATNSVEQVLPGLPVDTDYLLGKMDTRRSDNELQHEQRESSTYLHKEQMELLRRLHSYDPWMLSAQELMSLLRMLVDDLLSTQTWLEKAVNDRMETTYEMLKQKRAAEANHKKLSWANQRFETAKREQERKANKAAAAAAAAAAASGSTPANGSGSVTPMEVESGSGAITAATMAKELAMALSRKPTKGPPAKYIPPNQLEASLKAQLKAQDAYDKTCRTLVCRSGPIGTDRNHSEVYYFDGLDCFYVKNMYGKPRLYGAGLLPDDLIPSKCSWHIIEKRSRLNTFLESLDERGQRELELRDAILPLRRHVKDDVKEQQNKRAKIRDLQEMQRKYDNAKSKKDTGRRSGRLALQLENELAVLLSELEQLKKEVEAQKEEDAGKKKKSKKGAAMFPVPVIDDYEDATGLHMMRTFDEGSREERLGRRTVRRETRQQSKAQKPVNVVEIPEKEWTMPKFLCSTLWPTGHIDGSGIVGRIVSDMVELEGIVESLAPWGRTDVSRQDWIGNLETLIHTWHSIHVPMLGPMPEKFTSANGRRDSVSSTASAGAGSSGTTPTKRNASSAPDTPVRMESASQRRKIDQSTLTSALTTLKQPLLDLEGRVFQITGLKMATQDTDDADDNMSIIDDDDDDDEKEGKAANDDPEALKNAWKKFIHPLKTIQARYHAKVRDGVVNALTSARKAHNTHVVKRLKVALLEFHPEAAGACKAAALEILEEFGGYEKVDDGETRGGSDDDNDNNAMEDDADEAAREGENNARAREGNETGLSSALSAQAIIMNASLDGHEDCNRADWIHSVKFAKTLSKLAALTAAFSSKAKQKLDKLHSERANLRKLLSSWERAATKKTKKGRGVAAGADVSEVWTYVDFTDEFCLAKCENYPWWPARKCTARDPKIADSLARLEKCLVSLCGEMGALRVVNMNDAIPFTETLPDDGSAIGMSREIATQLDECMAMARRILRGKAASKKKSRKS